MMNNPTTTTLDVRLKAEQERRRRLAEASVGDLPDNAQQWLQKLFPKVFPMGFATHQDLFWDHIDSIKKDIRPKPFIGLWARGGTKSTSAEAVPVRLGAKGTRKYAWYVSGTQEQADSHVLNIGVLLEARSLSAHYPLLSQKAVGKYGNQKGWRRNRLSTAAGMTVDALGLDTGTRGVKFEEQRPDLIILDDVDDRHDTLETVTKKISIITESILPAGSHDCAVIFIQNLIHEDSIASRLWDGRAEFLLDRVISGPHPAIIDFTYSWNADEGKYFITGGTPTWEGQSLEVCQDQINTWGLSAFKREAQHDVEETGGQWDHIQWRWIDAQHLPDLLKVVVWVDPAVTSTDNSDCQGISCGGVDNEGHLYGLDFWEGITSPEEALEKAIDMAYDFGASYVGVETDQGGDTWKSVYLRALKTVKDRRIRDWELAGNKTPFPAYTPDFRQDKAGAGYGSKGERNQQLLTYYDQGNVAHVKEGKHIYLEKALRRWPKKPLDLADSWWWCYRDLVDVGGWITYIRKRVQNANTR